MPAAPQDHARLFTELEAQRTTLLAELSQWPASRLTYRPTPGAWSAVEVLDHIVRAEAGTIADIRNGLANPHTLGEEDRPNIAALDRALRSDRKFLVPADAGDIHPDPQVTFSDVTHRWQQARADLKSILDQLTPANITCGVFQHPFAGWMTVSEVLDHLSAHLHHHNYQLAPSKRRQLSQTSNHV